MTAYEIPNLRFSGESGAAVARRRFVKVNATETVEQTVDGEKAIGVSMNDASAAGEVLEIADGIVIVESGAAVASGAEVQSDLNGKAITKAAGVSNGTALTESTGAGQLITVKIN